MRTPSEVIYSPRMSKSTWKRAMLASGFALLSIVFVCGRQDSGLESFFLARDRATATAEAMRGVTPTSPPAADQDRLSSRLQTVPEDTATVETTASRETRAGVATPEVTQTPPPAADPGLSLALQAVPVGTATTEPPTPTMTPTAVATAEVTPTPSPAADQGVLPTPNAVPVTGAIVPNLTLEATPTTTPRATPARPSDQVVATGDCADGLTVGTTVLPWLRVEGNQIVDPAGRPIVLRGANVEDWQWNWEWAHDIEFERVAIPTLTGKPPEGWGANLIHIDFSSGPVNRAEAAYLQALDELVALAKSNGAYTLLSYRFTEPMDEPSRPDQAAEDAVARLAARYCDEPGVIYAVGSEPRNVTWAELKPRFTSMIDAIRTNNPKALIAVPGTEWGRYVYHNLFDPVERDDLAFIVSAFDTWDTIRLGDGYLGPYRLEEVAADHPLIIGGFGLGFRMTEMDDLRNLLDFAEERGISWTGWLFHDKGCPCMLKKPWQGFEPTEFGEEIRKRLQEAATSRTTARSEE